MVRRLVEEQQVRDRPRTPARARPGSARRPRTWRAAGRGARRRNRARGGRSRRAHATRSPRHARAEPGHGSTRGASRGRGRLRPSHPPAGAAPPRPRGRRHPRARIAERAVRLVRAALVVERNARALLERELAPVEPRLARQAAEQRRLAGAVRPGECNPSRRSSLNETPSKSGAPAISLRRFEAMRTAMGQGYRRSRPPLQSPPWSCARSTSPIRGSPTRSSSCSSAPTAWRRTSSTTTGSLPCTRRPDDLRLCGETFLGAFVDGRLAGFVSWKRDGDLLDLHRLAVDPAAAARSRAGARPGCRGRRGGHDRDRRRDRSRERACEGPLPQGGLRGGGAAASRAWTLGGPAPQAQGSR